ncbi:hypothetical protein GCM10010123_41970 [Pilimelia anulata]|uniref:Uncharacterized protein n=1 Tax=Pilimelia anulata TaxID=53371 RepID=A0A8J3BAP4_9ACTN|nr:hypothetical protein [Pilimelia anulata]GGK07613.1 hypothetical protein GCM10010123_41970 [Pilimelia anulata]
MSDDANGNGPHCTCPCTRPHAWLRSFTIEAVLRLVQIGLLDVLANPDLWSRP